jgi:hypothetical protein
MASAIGMFVLKVMGWILALILVLYVVKLLPAGAASEFAGSLLHFGAYLLGTAGPKVIDAALTTITG